MSSILFLGSTCVDVLIRVERLPAREDNLHPRGQRFLVGGCAYNAANIAGRGGADAVFVTPVGLKGVFGPYLQPILARQPWVRPVLLPDRENGCCYCLVEPDGERTFLSIHGAEYTFDPLWMAPLAGRHFDYAYVCGLEVEEETGGALTAWLESADVGRIFWAPGPRCRFIPESRVRRLLALRPILHLNRAEALTLSGAECLPEALSRLHGITGQPVIVTLGAEGCAVRDQQGERLIPGCPAGRVVDTVGAGDAHAGALLLGLSRGLPLDEALRLANRTAAQAVMSEGAALSDEALRAAGVLPAEPPISG